MLNPVIVVCERATSVIRRVDEDALDLAGELLFEGFKGKQVVAEDKSVVEQIVVGYTVLRVIGLFHIFKKDTGLQLWPVLLPNPHQFQFLLLIFAQGSLGDVVVARSRVVSSVDVSAGAASLASRASRSRLQSDALLNIERK